MTLERKVRSAVQAAGMSPSSGGQRELHLQQAGRKGYWPILVCCVLLLSLSGCGNGNDLPNTPEIATLDGSSPSHMVLRDSGLPEAKTKAHNKLRGFIYPDLGLLRGSAVYGNWNPGKGIFEAIDQEECMIPAVNVKYVTHEHQIAGGEKAGETANQTHTQRCTLTIFACPEAASAKHAVKKLSERVVEKGFKNMGPLKLSGTLGDKNPITTFMRIDDGEHAKVYSVYIQQIDHYVLYSVESEVTLPIRDAEGRVIPNVTSGQRGSRYGATMLVLTASRMISEQSN